MIIAKYWILHLKWREWRNIWSRQPHVGIKSYDWWKLHSPQCVNTIGLTPFGFVWLAGKGCSRGSAALVSVDCLCVAQDSIAGRRGNVRLSKEYNVTLLNDPNLLKSEVHFGTFFRIIQPFFCEWFLEDWSSRKEEKVSPRPAKTSSRRESLLFSEKC